MRQSYQDTQIPTPVEKPLYLDPHQIARGLCKHMTERFMGTVLGAGGAGGSLTGCPFRPAIIRVINGAGATPRVNESFFPDGGTAQHVSTTTAAATNANPPTITEVSSTSYTIGVPTQLAPNGETVIVECIGFRATGGSV